MLSFFSVNINEQNLILVIISLDFAQLSTTFYKSLQLYPKLESNETEAKKKKTIQNQHTLKIWRNTKNDKVKDAEM